jgi:hypothetical protein
MAYYENENGEKAGYKDGWKKDQTLCLFDLEIVVSKTQPTPILPMQEKNKELHQMQTLRGEEKVL